MHKDYTIVCVVLYRMFLVKYNTQIFMDVYIMLEEYISLYSSKYKLNNNRNVGQIYGVNFLSLDI